MDVKKNECIKILLGDQKEWNDEEDYILVPGTIMRLDLDFGVSFEDCVKEGAITTVGMYQTGQISIAHLFGDGKIRFHGQEVGTVDDITFLEPIKVKPTEMALSNLLTNFFERR